MKNKEIRDAVKNEGICLWQLAETLGLQDYQLSRKLRHELPADEREKALMAVKETARQLCAQEREGGADNGSIS